MPLPHAYRRLAQDNPDVIQHYEALADAVRGAGPLDGKSVALVKLGLALGRELEGGTHSAVRKALEAGCTPEELLHAALLATTTMGFPAMMRGRSWVLDVLEGKSAQEK